MKKKNMHTETYRFKSHPTDDDHDGDGDGDVIHISLNELEWMRCVTVFVCRCICIIDPNTTMNLHTFRVDSAAFQKKNVALFHLKCVNWARAIFQQLQPTLNFYPCHTYCTSHLRDNVIYGMQQQKPILFFSWQNASQSKRKRRIKFVWQEHNNRVCIEKIPSELCVWTIWFLQDDCILKTTVSTVASGAIKPVNLSSHHTSLSLSPLAQSILSKLSHIFRSVDSAISFDCLCICGTVL